MTNESRAGISLEFSGKLRGFIEAQGKLLLIMAVIVWLMVSLGSRTLQSFGAELDENRITNFTGEDVLDSSELMGTELEHLFGEMLSGDAFAVLLKMIGSALLIGIGSLVLFVLSYWLIQRQIVYVAGQTQLDKIPFAFQGRARDLLLFTVLAAIVGSVAQTPVGLVAMVLAVVLHPIVAVVISLIGLAVVAVLVSAWYIDKVMVWLVDDLELDTDRPKRLSYTGNLKEVAVKLAIWASIFFGSTVLIFATPLLLATLAPVWFSILLSFFAILLVAWMGGYCGIRMLAYLSSLVQLDNKSFSFVAKPGSALRMLLKLIGLVYLGLGILLAGMVSTIVAPVGVALLVGGISAVLTMLVGCVGMWIAYKWLVRHLLYLGDKMDEQGVASIDPI
jgi:hypothetical protein